MAYVSVYFLLDMSAAVTTFSRVLALIPAMARATKKGCLRILVLSGLGLEHLGEPHDTERPRADGQVEYDCVVPPAPKQ